MAKVQPLAERVLIKPIEKDQTTASGIIIPDTASKERPQKGEILAVGEEVKEVKVGNVVLFKQYGPNEFKLDGEELLIAKEEDILAILN